MNKPEDLLRSDAARRLLDGYQPPPGVEDEMLRDDGTLRPIWASMLRHLAQQSPEVLAQRFARGEQYLHDTGVYFRQYTKDGSTERDWPLSHVPVLIHDTEWQGLADGLRQRADLLEQVMADLYGEGRLVRDGLLPAELVARNPEWLRPMVGVKPRSGHHLHFLAFEVGRSPDGSWMVLGDRAQAPSGSGFALENRVATGRTFPELFAESNVHRLAGFFRQFRDALNGLRGDGEGRVGILTPGQHVDTYYEHAYIARYLGFLLLEAGELAVDRGRLTVRTINGAVPLDVLWRRLDSNSADPLELDEASAIGTPGLVSALRSGGLCMVNALGSGVMETRAFLAFLPRIAERLLDAPLALPNIATWWCGQQKERAYVLDHLDRMLIGPAYSTGLPFDSESPTVLGGQFRRNSEQPVRDWIAQDGRNLVGQEAVTLSTTPAMIDGKLQPRPMVLRVFAARTPEGWAIMPGGYARIGRTIEPTALAMQAGGSVADVWVMSDEPVQAETLHPASDAAFSRKFPVLLPARSADNLYWLGRYVERSETAVRLLRAYHRRLEAYGPDALPLTDRIAAHLETFGLDVDEPLPAGLLALLEQSRGCASKVRDRFSTDGWNALADLAATARRMRGSVEPGADAVQVMGILLRKIAGYSGLVHENMFRFDGWRFLTIGRALERADQTAALLTAFADPDAPEGGFDLAVELGDSVMTHRRRYTVETNRATVIDLLALDADNPRSVFFQVNIVKDEEDKLARNRGAARSSPVARQVLPLWTALSVAEPADLSTARLVDIRSELSAISDALTARYLS
ncbi:circularly permuted type 2 ATP-grasp protein [Thetidibacter halocola]|uniref:Circularly permuted type 2 ATP-grasp protein n=1 Tax=Thetidibacter halocola TaxID=2827239 RepID=A0A8J7WCY4_9RHOB|nr:circularly permuted type 2 ATP-grasp protein [Thetidibacter halocola]MBS0124452.1 circularly permuted type 2 ATP-grasp protein [Thetidibacter halocola]